MKKIDFKINCYQLLFFQFSSFYLLHWMKQNSNYQACLKENSLYIFNYIMELLKYFFQWYVILFIFLFSLDIQANEDFNFTLGLYGSYSKNIKEKISKFEDRYCPQIFKAVSSLFCVCIFLISFFFFVIHLTFIILNF